MGKPRSSVRVPSTEPSASKKAKALLDLASTLADAKVKGVSPDAENVKKSIKASGTGRVPLIPIYTDQTKRVVREIISPPVPPPPPVSVVPVAGVVVAPPVTEIDCTVRVVEYSTNPTIARKTVYYGGKKFDPKITGRWLMSSDWDAWPGPPWIDIPAGEPIKESASMLYTTSIKPPKPGYICKGVVAVKQPAPIVSVISTMGPVPIIRPPPTTIRPSQPPPPSRPRFGEVTVIPSPGISEITSLEFAARYTPPERPR